MVNGSNYYHNVCNSVQNDMEDESGKCKGKGPHMWGLGLDVVVYIWITETGMRLILGSHSRVCCGDMFLSFGAKNMFKLGETFIIVRVGNQPIKQTIKNNLSITSPTPRRSDNFTHWVLFSNIGQGLRSTLLTYADFLFPHLSFYK